MNLKRVFFLLAALALLGILWSREIGHIAPQASMEQQEASAGIAQNRHELRQPGAAQGRAEDLFRTSSSLGDALSKLIPRAQAGDYSALLVMQRMLVVCKAFRSKGLTAFDQFLVDKKALGNPARQEKISSTLSYCQDGGLELATSEEMLSRFSDLEKSAIKNGNAVAVLMGNITRIDMERIAPQAVTPQAIKNAIATVQRDGMPAEKYQVALARLISLGGDDVLKIDTVAIEAGIADVNRLHAAAAQLYGCEVGVDCAPGGEIQLSACLVEGVCQDISVQEYIRGQQLDADQLTYVDKYLAYLRKPPGN